MSMFKFPEAKPTHVPSISKWERFKSKFLCLFRLAFLTKQYYVTIVNPKDGNFYATAVWKDDDFWTHLNTMKNMLEKVST